MVDDSSYFSRSTFFRLLAGFSAIEGRSATEIFARGGDIFKAMQAKE